MARKSKLSPSQMLSGIHMEVSESWKFIQGWIGKGFVSFALFFLIANGYAIPFARTLTNTVRGILHFAGFLTDLLGGIISKWHI